MKTEDRAVSDFLAPMRLSKALPLGLQHVLAMFVGNLTPILLVTSLCGMVDGEFAALRLELLQNAMLVAGVVTLVQLYSVGPVGGKVPIIMGISASFIGVYTSVIVSTGGGVFAYSAILGAAIAGGIFEGVLGFFLKFLRQFFPPVVTGTVVLSIGLSLIPVGIDFFGGGAGVKDFASAENIGLGMLVLITILVFKNSKNFMIRSSAILLGIICGYVAAAVMGFVLPANAVAADGTVYVKAWVLDWEKVWQSAWFAVPSLLPVPLVFDICAVLPVCIMFVVSAVETVGDISAAIMGGMGREATEKELSGGVICDGFGSAFGALLGVLPCTSFSQNVGLVAMTKVVNRFALCTGAIFLIICGLVPKLSAIVSIMPQSVLGGAAVMMFASIVVSGIQIITRAPLTSRKLTIVSVAIGLGYGIGDHAGILLQMPETLRLIFGGSGIVPAALIAILMNIILPQEDDGR